MGLWYSEVVKKSRPLIKIEVIYLRKRLSSLLRIEPHGYILYFIAIVKKNW
jgi:hypothetical protein